MKNRRNTVIFLKRVTAALLSAAMVLSNLGFGGTGSISSKASTGSDTSAWSASAMMEKTGKTELYDAVKEYYTAVGTTDANAGKQEIWSRGAEKDFADIEFRDPVYSDGNKAAEVEIDITPADADTKINYVRTAGYFGDEGYATLSDATEASPANASGSNAGRKTWKFLTNVSWNDPAFVIYYTIPTEGDNGKLQWNAMDSEWVVEDDAVTDIANGAAAVLKCTDTVEISDITKLYEAYVKYLNGDTMSLEKLLASDVTDENGNKVTGLSISTDGLKSLFEDKERMAAQVDILKSAGYETALTAGSSFEELAAAYKTYPVSSYNSFFSAFTEKRSGTGKKAVRILATLLSAAGNPASSDTESNVVEVDLTKTIQNRTASTARKITFLEGPVLLGGVDENYMKLSDTGSITDVSEFDIGAINTQYITFSGYCKKISASNTDTGRKLIVKIPKGFTVSPATGFGDLDDSNKGFTFEGKDTTSDDNYVIYTWSWPDGADYTSAISFDGIQAKQDPAYLINHLTEGKTYDFIMECVNDSGTFDTRSFSLAPNSRTASYTVSSEVKTFSPSDLKTSFSQYSDPLPAGNPGSEFGTLDTKYFSVKVTKTEGHLPETFNIAVPCPSELASAITRMGYVHIVFTDANSKTTALFEYNRVGGDWSSWSYDSTAKMFHISLDGAAMASAFKVLNTGSTVEDDILKAGTIEFQYTFRVDQNKLPLEQTGTLLGNPKPMGTEITMTAEDAITLNYNTFAAADHAALSAAGSQFGLKWHNGTPSITHPYKINDNDNYQYTKQAQGTVTDAKAEIFKDASSGSAFQSHFSVAMEYEEAFSPVNIATSYSRYDQDADLDFTYTVTVTSLDASGNSLGTETMSENPGQGEVISIDETALSALKKSGAASWYVSKIEITNPSLTTVSSGDLNLSLKYRALKNTQAGIAAGEDKIPNNYPATIKYTYGSDQFSTVTETAKVLLIDTLDNLYLKSVTDLSGDSSSVPVNENVAMYLLGQFVITKYQDTMTYQAPFPTAVVSGKGLGLADYFSATDQKIISYTDEKGTVHQVSEDVLKSATEDYSGRATGDASYSGKNHLYNLKKIFDQCGGTYAVSVTLSLYAVNDWACTQLLWGGPNGRYMGYDHYASFYASKVMPGYMGYDEIVKKGTVAGLSDLGDAYDYHVELTCNSSAHTDFNHNKLNGKTAKLVRGDVPGGIEVRDISYYLAGALSSAASGKPNYMFNEWVGAEYAPRRAFLAGMQITGWNKGSAGRRNMNLHNLVFDFSGSDPDALALTQGISFSITQGSLPWTFRGSPRYEAYNSARYLDNRDGAKTDAGVMSGDQTKSTYKVLYTTKQGSKGEKTCYFSVSSSPYDYVYQDLTDCLKDSSDYFTSLKITMSPLGAIGWADTFGISDVLPTPMLVHKGGIPKAYPDSKIAVGEKHLSAAYSATVSGGMEDNENYDQLPIRTVMSFNDIYGTTVTKLEAEGKTARIAGQKIIYNTLYASAGYSTDAVFQGKTFDASLYLWIRETDAPTATDPAFKPRPVFYVKMDKDFKYTGKARYSTSDYGTVNFTYVEPGTEAGESGSSDYGFLVIDLSQSYGLYRDRYKYDASLFNCTVTLEASPYAKVGQYNAEIGSRPIPIKTVWADVAYDRNSRGTSETVNNRNYSVDLDKLSTAEKVTQVKQTDSAGIAAPYGENYNNSPDADYPARDTTADGRDNAEMLLAELDTGKTVSASSTAGMYMRAIAHMPYQYASSVTSKDILKADEDGYKLFGADINIIGYKENDTHDWVSYIPIPRQSSVLSHKTGKYTDDFGLKLISLDTSGVDDAKDFEIWYSTDPAPDKNGLSGGSDSGYTKLTKEQVTGGKLPEGITMLKLTAAVMPKATRDNLTLSYRMQSHKTDIGIKKAYSTLWYNFQNVGETSYQTKNGFEDAVCTYSLTDMYVTGKVWMEADYNSVYNSTDTLLKGREVKLLDPLNSAAEVNQGTKILTASDGSYVLTAPHDGKLTVQVIPDQTEQFVEQFKKSTAAGTHVADESWFDRSTGKTTDVNFVSDYFTSGYTMKYVDAGLALNPVITTTPVKVHIGDISDPATVNVTNIKDGSVPAVAADPAHSQEMTVTDNGDGTYTVKSEGTEKKTGLITDSVDISVSDGYGGTYTVKTPVTVYAKVIYEANGPEGTITTGTVPTDDSEYYPEEKSDHDKVTVMGKNSLLNNAYDFAGWATSADADTAAYAENATFNTGAVTEDVILYAVWTPRKFPVTYRYTGKVPEKATPYEADMNDVHVLDTEGTYHTEQTVSTAKVYATGYAFSGWILKKETGTDDVTVTDGTFVMPAHQVDFTGYFTPNRYDVIFDKNAADASGTVSSQTMTYDEQTALNKNSYTREGYLWKGWATNSDAAEVVYADEQSVMNLCTGETGDTGITLYAVWEEMPDVVITYRSADENMGTVDPGSENVAPVTGIPAGSAASEKTGYRLTAWTNEAGETVGSALHYTPVKTGRLYVTQTYTAHFAPISYTVVFDKNGADGTETMDDEAFVYDEEKPLDANRFTNTGKKFLGWSIKKDAESADYEDAESVKNLSAEDGGSVTLFAVWQNVNPQITQDPPVRKTVVQKSGSAAFGAEEDYTYTFTMMPDSLSAPMPEAVKDVTVYNEADHSLTAKITGNAAGTYGVEFGMITYTKPGTYSYTLSETKGGNTHIEYDGRSYTMKVIIEWKDAARTELKKTVFYTNSDGMEVSEMLFTNTYNRTASGGPSGGGGGNGGGIVETGAVKVTEAAVPAGGRETEETLQNPLTGIGPDGVPLGGFPLNGILPKTGEEWNRFILSLLLVAGVAGVLVLIGSRRKKENEEK